MSNKAQLSKKQMEELSLDDLLSGLDSGKLAKAASSQTRPKKAQLLSSENEREALIAQAAERHRQTQEKISPWLPECVVLYTQEVLCTHCQSTFRYPAANSLLIRFRHRRNGSSWEVANHPSQLNPALPREQQTLYSRVHACENCFRDASVLTHYSQQTEMETKL